jgi:hypothetical protein
LGIAKIDLSVIYRSAPIVFAGESTDRHKWIDVAGFEGGIMKTYVVLLSCIGAMVSASSCWALNGYARAECLDGKHVVTISGVYREDIDGEIVGIVLRREAIGVCVADVFVPEEPLPFLPLPNPGHDYSTYEAVVTIDPPLDGVACRYLPFGVRSDGSLVQTENFCDADSRTGALAACDGIPFARGSVEIGEWLPPGEPMFHVVSCESDCWTESFRPDWDIDTLEGLTGEPWVSSIGRVVDVFGERTYCGLPGDDRHNITGIEFAPGGLCGPVPVDNTSWGALKAMYK